MESTWPERDLPVLRAIVEAFDDVSRYKMSLPEIEAATALTPEDVQRALRALNEADPPLIRGTKVGYESYPIMITGVTERARVLAGQWPTPDAVVDQLVMALEEAAENEEDAGKRSALRRVAGTLGTSARELVVQVLGEAIGRATFRGMG